MLATGSVMATATTLRLSMNCLELLAQRTPPLVRLGITASAGADNGRAQAEFRDELLALTRDAAETTWRELRKGIDDMDALTRPTDDHPTRTRQRPHRVKP
jgi:hypothetical protein